MVAADLRTALGMFRQRIAPWLQQHGISLDWQMTLPPLGGYGPRETLHLFRILQEACSNVVRHSGAGRVSIAAIFAGLCAAAADRGRGQRARRRGIQVSIAPVGDDETWRTGRNRWAASAEVEFTRAGTVVRLDLPRPAPTHESA